VLLTAETHAYPAVPAAKEVAAIGVRGSEVIRRTTNNPVTFRDDARGQFVVPGRQSI
jgi:hypothetical protein